MRKLRQRLLAVPQMPDAKKQARWNQGSGKSWKYFRMFLSIVSDTA
jgi:hypothetical protein